MTIKDVSQLSAKMNMWVVEQTKKMQLDLFTGIVADTPVDTGTARDGWVNTDINNIGDTGLINNDVPYIGWLEFGTNTQAPHAMVQRNINRVVGK